MIQRPQHLLYLLQFESFQDSIRTILFKLGENRLTIFAYVIGSILVLLIIFRFLAHKK